ncbi:MAG: LysE family translocator [SAR324 cluster bacterium]|nr:LysE family translocator [SAR324 cluster bacterium]
MVSFAQLGLFASASLLLIFTPGPDVLYVMTRGMSQGKKAALAAAAGFGLGNLVHTLFAVLGLSALLMSSSMAFQLVKYAGAAYLIYLGIKLFRSHTAIAAEGNGEAMSCMIIFRQSIIANVLNPKVAVFFLAFFPQFIDQVHGNPQLQMIVLGCVFVILAWAGFSIIGLCSGWIREFFKKNPKTEKRISQAAGILLVLLGLKLALSGDTPFAISLSL